MTGPGTDREKLTFGEAAALYARLAGWYITEQLLIGHLTHFPHLCVFRHEDAYCMDLGAAWLDPDRNESFVMTGIDRKRFEYFVKTRRALYGTGNPELIFTTNVAPTFEGSRRGGRGGAVNHEGPLPRG